jgi:hypothetical protein
MVRLLRTRLQREKERNRAKIRRLCLITEIRHMVGNRRSYREILDTLGIPERTFYRYIFVAGI